MNKMHNLKKHNAIYCCDCGTQLKFLKASVFYFVEKIYCTTLSDQQDFTELKVKGFSLIGNNLYGFTQSAGHRFNHTHEGHFFWCCIYFRVESSYSFNDHFKMRSYIV